MHSIGQTTKSTATRCRIHIVAKTGNKIELNVYGNSRPCCRFVAGFGNSRLSTKSTVLNSTLSPVCTTGLKETVREAVLTVAITIPLSHESHTTTYEDGTICSHRYDMTTV